MISFLSIIRRPCELWHQGNRLAIYLIVSVTVATFLPVVENGFVWDDELSLVNNHRYRGLAWSNLRWMFTTFHDANYHPLTWFSFGIDFQLWGMNPFGYHLTNLLLHAINAVLFYRLVLILISRSESEILQCSSYGLRLGAFVGALFFSVHPLRAEVVAWLSTRSDLLCAAFFMATIIAYLLMNDFQRNSHKWHWYSFSLFSFTLSLLCRAWGITMPVVLLILDVYPLRRFARKKESYGYLLMEKVPYALLASAAGILSVMAKKPSMKAMELHGLLDRVSQAAYGLWLYVHKTFAPSRLSPLYLLKDQILPFSADILFSAFAVAMITTLLLAMRNRWPWGLTSWGCYAVIVSPLLGFVQSGPQIAADRYTYLSCLPFGILVAAAVMRLFSMRKENRLPDGAWKISIAGILAVLCLFSIISYRQSKIWKDENSLWSHAIRLDPENTMAYYNRGLFYQNEGNKAGAFMDFSMVIQLNPKDYKSYNNRGALRKTAGDIKGALQDFEAAIRINSSSPEEYANRGACKLSMNDPSGAIQDFNQALKVAPSFWSSRNKVEGLFNKTLEILNCPIDNNIY